MIHKYVLKICIAAIIYDIILAAMRNSKITSILCQVLSLFDFCLSAGGVSDRLCD